MFWEKPRTAYASQSIIDSEDPSLVYWPSLNEWGKWDSDTAYGGSVRITTYPGATVSYTFYGTSVTYLYTMAFNRGAVKIYIDGEDADTIVDRLNGHINDVTNDQTRIPRRQTAKTFSGLSNTYHTITIEANPGEDGNRIYTDLDAFIINPNKATTGTYDDTTIYAMVFNQNNWYTWNCGDCYNGSYKYTYKEGNGIRFTFEGDSITWYYSMAANRGKAGVTIDGENKNFYYGYFDLYNPFTIRNQYKTFTGLGGGTHTITIYNIHQKNPASSDYLIDFDKLVVGSSISYQRTKASNYVDARAHEPNCSYYFPTRGGCKIIDNDCINYASQSMHESGFPYVPPSPPFNDWSTNWYYDSSIQDSSTTWRYIPSFMQYQAGRTTEFTRTNSIPVLRRGDLVPLDLWLTNGMPGQDGIEDHIRVIVGAGLSSPFHQDYNCDNCIPMPPDLVFDPQFGLLIDQHTTDRWQVPWDYNVPDAAKLDFIHIIKN